MTIVSPRINFFSFPFFSFLFLLVAYLYIYICRCVYCASYTLCLSLLSPFSSTYEFVRYKSQHEARENRKRRFSSHIADCVLLWRPLRRATKVTEDEHRQRVEMFHPSWNIQSRAKWNGTSLRIPIHMIRINIICYLPTGLRYPIYFLEYQHFIWCNILYEKGYNKCLFTSYFFSRIISRDTDNTMIPLNIRYQAVVHYKHFLRSLRKVSALYKVSKSSLHRWINSDSIAKGVMKRNKQLPIDVENVIRNTVKSNPFISMPELSHLIATRCGIQKSRHTVSRWRRQCGIVRKKATRVVDTSKNINPFQVNQFCDSHVNKHINGNIICIDEAGFIIGDHGRYGYISKGQRLNILSGKTVRRRKLTLLMAIDLNGVLDYKILPHNCKKDDFVSFIRNLNAPIGSTFLMDNIAFHHSKETQMEVQKKQCEQLFIPPYSPKFNAIENVFGVIKNKFRLHCPHVVSDYFDYKGLMENILETFRGTDLSNYFNRAVAFSIRIKKGESFINYEQ